MLNNLAVPGWEDEDSAAGIGKIVHAMLGHYFNPDLPDVPNPPDEALMLYRCALNTYHEEVEPYFCAPTGVEVTLNRGNLTGHADLVMADREKRTLTVLDWKTGRTATNYDPQLLGYLARAIKDGEEWDAYYTVQVDVRDQSREIKQWTRRQIDDHLAKLTANLEKAVDLIEVKGFTTTNLPVSTYTTGPQCETCSAAKACPAVGMEIRALMRAMEMPEVRVDLMPVGQIAKARTLTKIVSRWIDQFEDGARKRVEEMGKPIPLGDGKVWGFRDETSRVVRADNLKDTTLGELTGGKTVRDIATVSVGALEAAVKKHANKEGLKIGETVKAAMARLEAEGALVKVPSRKFTEMKE